MKHSLFTMLLSLLSLNMLAAEHKLTVGSYVWDTEVTEAFLTIPDLRLILSADGAQAYNNSFFLVWKHNHQHYPNLKFSINIIEHSGTGTFEFGQSLSNFSGKLDMSNYDLTAFWTVIQTPKIILDIGITARLLDGIVDNQFLPLPLDTVLPLLYTHTLLPFGNNYSVGLELMGGEWDDQKAVDMSLYGAYTLDIGLGFNAGYRLLNTDVETYVKGQEEIDAFTGLDFKGFYAGMFYHF